MTDSTSSRSAHMARRARHEAILAEVAAEEAEQASALDVDVPMHLRIDRQLDAQLRQRAHAEPIPTSALVHRLLRQALYSSGPRG